MIHRKSIKNTKHKLRVDHSILILLSLVLIFSSLSFIFLFHTSRSSFHIPHSTFLIYHSTFLIQHSALHIPISRRRVGQAISFNRSFLPRKTLDVRIILVTYFSFYILHSTLHIPHFLSRSLTSTISSSLHCKESSVRQARSHSTFLISA